MKKYALIVGLLVLTWQINAETNNFKQNEIKLDAAYLLNKTVKVEYEHFLNDWSSVGAAAFYNFGKTEYQYYKTQLLATYRLYFGKQPVSGFFLEVNSGVASGRHNDYGIDIGEKSPLRIPYTSFGYGFALGYKHYIPNPSVTLDLFFGLGRLFGEDSIGSYFRMGITVGKRF